MSSSGDKVQYELLPTATKFAGEVSRIQRRLSLRKHGILLTLVVASLVLMAYYSNVLSRYTTIGWSMNPRRQCSGGASVLFIIKSERKNDERRQIIRNTLLEPQLVKFAGIAGVFFVNKTLGKGQKKYDDEDEAVNQADVVLYNASTPMQFIGHVYNWTRDNCPNVKFVVHMTDAYWPHLHYLKHYLHSMDPAVFHCATKSRSGHPMRVFANSTIAIYSNKVFPNIGAGVKIEQEQPKVAGRKSIELPKITLGDINTYTTMEFEEDPDLFNVAAVIFYMYRFPFSRTILERQWKNHLVNTTGVQYANLYRLGQYPDLVPSYEL